MVAELLHIPHRHGLVVDRPAEHTRDGTLRPTVIGEEDATQAAFPDVPDGGRAEVTRTGEYRPDGERLFAERTRRQQEVLRTAMEMGSYREPRRVTYEDIATEVGRTATTVGEHPRKVEAQVRADVP